MKKLSHDELLQEAQKLWHSGHDNEYIHGQLSELNADDDEVKRVLGEINSIRKSEQRRKGTKLVIGGLATVVIAVFFTWFSFSSDSPVVYVLYGMIVTGIMTFAKGVVDIIF